MKGKFPEISCYRAEFHRLTDAGTGHPATAENARVSWDAVSFHTAIAAAAKKRFGREASPNLRTVRNWFDRRKDDIPQERYLEPILDVLFPGNTEGRGNFRALWQVARQARRALGADTDMLDPESAPAPTEWWDVTAAENIGLGLAALFVHPQPKSNMEDNSFLLQLSLSLARRPDEIEGLSVILGLRAAHLRLDHANCQPRPTEEGPEHVKERGGVYAVTGPTVEGYLQGRPLTNGTLVTMERTGVDAGAAKVTVSLRSRHRDLEVVPEDPDQDISAARAKILQLFLQECHVSETDRQIVWARASLTEKTRA
jgi:hypothetical protein